MPDAPAPTPDALTKKEREQLTLNRLILTSAGVLVIVLIGVFLFAIGPRWWAQRVGSMIDGRLFVGSMVGIVIGTVFTALPIVFLAAARNHMQSIKKALIALLIGLTLALPNIATLAIVVGTGGSAHAAERVLDVSAPGFRAGSVIGVILGALFGGWIAYLMWSRRRRGEELARLRAAEKERALAEAAPPVSGVAPPEVPSPESPSPPTQSTDGPGNA